MESKKWYASKTLWTNILGAAVLFIQSQTGFVINPAVQGIVLAGVNLILRKITKQPIIW